MAVAEELSFTRASRRLHVVQSGVSSSIQGLERELGVVLFDRDRHRVTLTDAGRALLPEARTTLAAAQAAAEAVAEAAAGLRGSLTIGTMLSTGQVDLPGLLGDSTGSIRASSCGCGRFPAGRPSLAARCSAGRWTWRCCPSRREPPAGLSMRTLAQQQLVLVCPASHSLASAGEVTLAALASESFIDFPEGWGIRAIVDQAFAIAGLERQLSFEVADYPTAAGLVRDGLGVAFVPASVAAVMDGVARVPLSPDPLTWRLSVATASARRLPSRRARLHGPASHTGVADAKQVKNRLHLDLNPGDGTLTAELERLTALGATVLARHNRGSDLGWFVLADPEGNEFCVTSSDAEVAVVQARLDAAGDARGLAP